MKGFSAKLELRIDWSEIDLFGHVNNLAILKYEQASRVNYLESVGTMQSHAETKIDPILASISSQFRIPLFYPGTVTVYSKVDSIKNTSFRIHHEIYNDKDELAAIVQDIIVYYDFVNNVKLTIPDEIRGKFDGLGNKDFNTGPDNM